MNRTISSGRAAPGRWGVLVLAALLALPQAAFAPATSRADPESAAAREEVRVLTHELRRESIERVVASIAARLERAGEDARAERVRRRMHPSRSFVDAHLEADAEKTIQDLFRSELSARTLTKDDLKIDLDLFRGWRSGFRVREVPASEIPASVTGFDPPRSRGFPPEVAALNNNVAHSIGDLRDYISDRFTLAALDRAIEKGHVIEIHAGSQLEALSDLVNRGFNVFGEVKTPNGNFERLYLAEGPGGEIRYVVSGAVEGVDRIRHLAALLRFAGETGRRVRSDRVEIVGDVATIIESNEATLREGFSRMPLEGTTAIIGFRATLANELTRRALAQHGIEHLRDVLGANPYQGLLAALGRERDRASGAQKAKIVAAIEQISADDKLREALSLSPREVFMSARNLRAFLAAEKTLANLASQSGAKAINDVMADGKVRLPGGVSASTVSAARALEHGDMRADEVLTRTGEGIRSVLLVNNYYGDRMGAVARALLGTGWLRLAYFGTAGGIASNVRVGDIHVPAEIFDAEHRRVGSTVPNSFIEHFSGADNTLGDRLRLSTRLGNVWSPAEETMPWLNDARARGLDAVEVENSHIVEAVAEHNRGSGPKAQFFTSVTISDVPGSHQTLGNFNGSSSHTFARMVDHYLEALKIDNIVLQQAESNGERPIAVDPKERAARDVADRLVPRALDQSRMLRERIAEILESSLDRTALESIGGTGKLKPSQIPGLSESARAALELEVAKAYTDKQLGESLRRANAVVSRLAEELNERHPNSNFRIRLGGGIERGAFSPARGLTVEIAGSGPAAASAAEILPALIAEVSNAPRIELGGAGSGALELDRRAFVAEPEPLVRHNAGRALEQQGAVFRGNTVRFVGRQHRGAPIEELAGLTLPELIVRARRALGRGVPASTNRAELLSALTGIERTEVETITREARRAEGPAPTVGQGRGLIGAILDARGRETLRRSVRRTRGRSPAR